MTSSLSALALLLWAFLRLTSPVNAQDHQRASILDTNPIHVEDFGVPPATSTILLYDCTGSHRPKPDDPGAFQVFHNGEWWNQFCQDELVWNQTLCRCEYLHGKRPSVECRDYRAASGESPQNYEQLVNGNWIVRDCSLAVAGLVWDQTACQCVWGPESKEMVTGQGITPCDIMLNMTFEHGVKDDAKGSFVEVGRGSALPIQTLETRDSFRGTKAAYFTDTALNIWYFAGNEIGTSLRVEFRFKMVNDPAKRDMYQIFLSNGCNVSVPGYTTPSLAIGYRAADQSYLLAFETASARKAIVCTQKLGAYKWHTVSLIYEDGTLLLRVDEKPCIISQDFTGPIQKTSCPLTIGADPLERESMYKGYLDNLLIARYCRRYIDRDPTEVNDKGPMPIETVPALPSRSASQSVPEMENPDRGNRARTGGRVQVSKYWSNFQVNRNRNSENSGKDRTTTRGSGGSIGTSWLTEETDRADKVGEIITDNPRINARNSNAHADSEGARQVTNRHPSPQRAGGSETNHGSVPGEETDRAVKVGDITDNPRKSDRYSNAHSDLEGQRPATNRHPSPQRARGSENNYGTLPDEESNGRNLERPNLRHSQNEKSRMVPERQQSFANPRVPERKGNDNEGNLNRQTKIHNKARSESGSERSQSRQKNGQEEHNRSDHPRISNLTPRPPNNIRIMTEAQSETRKQNENPRRSNNEEKTDVPERQHPESQGDRSDARSSMMEKAREVDASLTSEKMRERPRREKPRHYPDIPDSIKEFIDIDRVLHFVDYVEKSEENSTQESPPSLVKGRRRGGSKKKAWYDKVDSEDSEPEETVEYVVQSPFQRPKDKINLANNNNKDTPNTDVVITNVESEVKETETSGLDGRLGHVPQQKLRSNILQDQSKSSQEHTEANRLNRHQVKENTTVNPGTQNKNSNVKDRTLSENLEIVNQRGHVRRVNNDKVQRHRPQTTAKFEHVKNDDVKKDDSSSSTSIHGKNSETDRQQERNGHRSDNSRLVTNSRVIDTSKAGNEVVDRPETTEGNGRRNSRRPESTSDQSKGSGRHLGATVGHRSGDKQRGMNRAIKDNTPEVTMDEVIGWYDKSFTDVYPPYDGTEYEKNHKDLKPDPSLSATRRAHKEGPEEVALRKKAESARETRNLQPVTSQKSPSK